MFGYVIPLKPELKVREFNEFRGYYCGLCMAIKKNFGNVPRMTLNYDMTFLALLLDSLSSDKAIAKLERCIAHPTHKKAIIQENNALKYAANMNISLTYFKLLDDINDDKDLKSKSLALILSPYKRKFHSSILEINNIIRDNLNKLSQLENSKNFSSIDEICDPFSIIVGKILELYPHKIDNDSIEKRNILYNLGYSLGKWIYLIDALDDLEDDMKKNKFNPINYLYNKDNKCYDEFIVSIKDRLEFSILNCACNCRDYLNELNPSKNKGILDNIINLGMMDKYTNIINKYNCKNTKGSDLNESI